MSWKSLFERKVWKNWSQSIALQNFQNSSDYYDFYLEPCSSHKIVVSHYVDFYLEGTLSLSVRVYVITTEINEINRVRK